jgi:hypothetical protein
MFHFAAAKQRSRQAANDRNVAVDRNVPHLHAGAWASLQSPHALGMTGASPLRDKAMAPEPSSF